MKQTYKAISATECINSLKGDLPLNLRLIVWSILDAATNSIFYARTTKLNYIYKLELVEHNKQENFTICHCFSTDTISTSEDNYTHETISLPNLKSLYQLVANI